MSSIGFAENSFSHFAERTTLIVQLVRHGFTQLAGSLLVPASANACQGNIEANNSMSYPCRCARR